MALTAQSKKLGFLGEDFQFKLVHEFVEDKEFFKDLCDIIDQNEFTDPNLKVFVGVMKEYYKTYQNVPGYDAIRHALVNKAHTDTEKEFYEAIVEKVHNVSSESSLQTRNLSERFFKQQNMIRVANEIIKLASKGDTNSYDKCVEMLNKAMMQGTSSEMGSSVFDDENETLSEDYRIAIPTGIGKIDETLEGGLGKGELGVIVGSSSFGKAQPLDSRILTPNGYKTMGEMKVGDLVIGGDGKPHEVTGVFPQGKRPIYKVSFSNGSSCECDIEHLWNVNGGNVLSLKEILDKGLIKDKQYQFTIPSVDIVEFEGTTNITYSFTKEKPIPNEILFGKIEIRQSVIEEIKKQSTKVGKKTKFEVYYFDSDRLSKAKQIRFLVMSLGYVGLNATVEIGKDISYRTIFFKKEDKLPIFMMSAEYVGEKEAQCIMVDSDEHLYVTEDFIVTHNTSLTTAMASHAATYRCQQNNNDGYKVLQIVFEDRIKQIQRKHMGRITGIEAKDLSKPGIVDRVKEQLAHYSDRETMQKNIRIVRLPSGEKTADDIKRLILKLRNIGFSPDLVIVDYFECLLCRGDSSDDKWEKEGKTMRKFESIAGELNIAIWIPVQGTKDSLNVEVVTMDKAGGSFKKIQIAHIVMSIARTVEDIESNLATIAILKNRAGKAGKVFNGVEFNNGTCRISTDHIDEYETQAAFIRQQDREMSAATTNIFELVKNSKK